MRVFLTGATGFIGSAVIPELIDAGHHVLGLTRSDAGAQALTRAGADVHRGDLDDLESLRRGAEQSDAVIHLAFNHDFSQFAANCEADRRAIEAIGSVFAGSDRPLIVTSGTAIANAIPGRSAVESDPAADELPRAASEAAVDALAARGINVSVVRLSQVHDAVKQGLITYLVALARQKGVSAYVGEGRNRWAAVHISDAARLYRLALEKAERGVRSHAVDEEGVELRKIAEVIGRGLNVPVASLSPEEMPAHFGWLSAFAARDMPASSAQTQERLGWHPSGPSLIADLQQMRYHHEPAGH